MSMARESRFRESGSSIGSIQTAGEIPICIISVDVEVAAFDADVSDIIGHLEKFRELATILNPVKPQTG